MWNVCHLRHLPDITNKLIYDFSRVLRCAWGIVGDESVGFSTGFGKEWRQVWKETCHNCRDTSPQKSQKGNKNERLQYLPKLYQQKASASQRVGRWNFPLGLGIFSSSMSVFGGKMADLRRIAPKKGDSSVFQHKICGGQTGSRRKTATNDHLENLHLWPLFWKEWKTDLLSQKDHEIRF